MDAVLLAAGYGTRLYPVTKDRPKALLPIGGRPVVDHLVEQLDPVGEIERIIVVSNARFHAQFEDWAGSRRFQTPLVVLNDGTVTNEDRLGAIGDMLFALEQVSGAGENGIYAMGTDNLPRFDLRRIIRLSQDRGASAVFAVRTQDRRHLRRKGVARLAADGRVVHFEEKPEEPESDLTVPPFYVYVPDAVGLIETYLESGFNPDAPGHLLAWMVARQDVYAYASDVGTYDIGTLESYRAVCREFAREGEV